MPCVPIVFSIIWRMDKASPLSREVWVKVGPQFSSAVSQLFAALASWAGGGLGRLQLDNHGLLVLAGWAVLTVALWWVGRALRHRYGRGESREPGDRDRTIAAAIDGVGLVLVPILAVWLIGKVLAATSPPPPLDMLVPELISLVITFLLVIGLSAAALSPARPKCRRPTW